MIPVYSSPEDLEKYWLFRLAHIGKRKIEGCWYQKLPDPYQYMIGESDKILCQNIVRPAKLTAKIFMVMLENKADNILCKIYHAKKSEKNTKIWS